MLAALAAAAVGSALEGAVLLALFSLSGTLEHRAMGRARRAVEALMQLRPETALKLEGDQTVEVPVETLVPGDRVILRPGARVPVDGRIVQGEGSLDESTITGESLPQKKGPGAPVHEACVNLNAILTVEVTRPLADSTVARMIRLVTEAQAMKAPSERFSDWFGQRYTVAVLAGSILSFFGFRWAGYEVDHALYHAATLLVAASPCAVVISVPRRSSRRCRRRRAGRAVQGRRRAGAAGHGEKLCLRQDRHADHRPGRGDRDPGAAGDRGRLPGHPCRDRGTFRTPHRRRHPPRRGRPRHCPRARG